MKHTIMLFSLLLSGLLASCNEEVEVQNNPDHLEPGYGLLSLTMDLTKTGTKADEAVAEEIALPAEKEIKDVAFFVHTEADEQGDGSFGKYFSGETESSENKLNEELTAIPDVEGQYKVSIIHCSDGWKNPEVVVIANYKENDLEDELKAVSNWEELQAFTTSATQAENAKTPLLMCAQQTIKSWESTPVVSGGGSVVETIKMKRMVSRIDVRNYAYNPTETEKNFVLTAARLVRPRIAVPLVEGSKTLPVSSSSTFPFGGTVEEFEVEAVTFQKVDCIYTYENENKEEATATAIQLEGTLGGVPITKIVDFKKLNVAQTPIALARNRRYLININPAPDKTDVNFDIEVADWSEGEEIRVKPSFPKAEMKIADVSALTDAGMIWDATKKVIDITSATGTASFTFTTTGNTATQPEVKLLYDKTGTSVGWNTEELKAAAVSFTPSIADEKAEVVTTYTVTVPYQQSLKVPVDIILNIHNANNKGVGDTIIIRSVPGYTTTGIKPVLMSDGRYWAPVNVGAIKLPENVPEMGDITETCGQLFQWGRKAGFNLIGDKGSLQKESSAKPGKDDIATMETKNTWAGKFLSVGANPWFSVSDGDTWYE
ncbi:MAG: FimB/Mfa2 family fimbrial subunit [Parabacteroides sp.]|nr:FimB/Mfa2 family fimbrial subunit [Parabacteroides sp.]